MTAGEMKMLLDRIPDGALILLPDEYGEGGYKEGELAYFGYADPEDDSVDGIFIDLLSFKQYDPDLNLSRLGLEPHQFPVIAFSATSDDCDTKDRPGARSVYESI